MAAGRSRIVWQLLVFIGLALFQCTLAQNCSERCCYWYQRVPGNSSDCHVSEGGTAALTCGVYAPRDSNNATVKWYRIIESVVEDISDRYENSVVFTKLAFNSPNSPIDGLFQDNYKLTIGNINSSDSGVYRCEISADGFCFIPSAYVNITVNSSLNENDCSSFSYQWSPVCAVNNSSSCHQVTPTSFLVHDFTPTVMTNISLTSSLISMSPVAIPRIPTSPTNSSVLVGSLSFIIALLAVMLLITISIFALAWMRRDNKNQCETCRSKGAATILTEHPNDGGPVEDPYYSLPNSSQVTNLHCKK